VVRRSPLAALVAGGLSFGTLATALVMHAVFPVYYVERAVLPAALGLALLVGAAVGGPRPAGVGGGGAGRGRGWLVRWRSRGRRGFGAGGARDVPWRGRRDL